MAQSDLASKAKEAFVDDDFELAAEFYTQAIDAVPATADLYADRAQAHIKLGNYTGACARAPLALPCLQRPPPPSGLFGSIAPSGALLGDVVNREARRSVPTGISRGGQRCSRFRRTR
jgi:hypothetical protein